MMRDISYLSLLVVFTATNSQSNLQPWATSPSPPWLNGRPITIAPFPESNSLITVPTHVTPNTFSSVLDIQKFPPNSNVRSTVLSPVQDVYQRTTHSSGTYRHSTTLPTHQDEISPGPAPSFNPLQYTNKPVTSLPERRPNIFDDDLSHLSEFSGQKHSAEPSLADRLPTSYQNSNLWTTNAPQPSNYPFIVSPYYSQGTASNYYVVAVPKPPQFSPNTSVPIAQNITKYPSSSVEIFKSIELPFGRMPYSVETTTKIPAKERLNYNKMEQNNLQNEKKNISFDYEKENKKRKRSELDEAASTSLFRPETVKGFRALFLKAEPYMSDKNITIVDNNEMVMDKNLTGPIFYTKSAINIFVQDPGLINVMQNKFKEISAFPGEDSSSNSYQYSYPGRNNGISTRAAKSSK